jgi:hypothetical protein
VEKNVLLKVILEISRRRPFWVLLTDGISGIFAGSDAEVVGCQAAASAARPL